MNPMTTLILGSHRRRLVFLLAGMVLMIVVFFATRRAASFTDRAHDFHLTLRFSPSAS